MKKLLVALVVCLLVLSAVSLAAEGALTLGRSKTAPTVDGVVSAGEYTLTVDSGAMRLYLSWVGDTLAVAVSGQTAGWVAVGFGSARMNDSVMYLGAAGADAGTLAVQKGKGHGHADLDGSAPSSYAVKETDGQTVLELSLPATAVIPADGKKLDVIYAFGGGKAFMGFHKGRFAAAVALLK
jgi:hypothetical protein